MIKKNLSKVGLVRTYINVIKATCDNPTASIVLNKQKLKMFHLTLGTKQVCLHSPLLFNIALEVLAISINEEEIKDI